MQDKEYKVKKYEAPQMISDVIIHKIVDCGYRTLQLRAIKNDIANLFESIETVISKYSDQFHFHKQVYYNHYDEEKRFQYKFWFVTVILRAHKRKELMSSSSSDSLN